MSEVCILGCGPAGLMAAHAAATLGYTPFIISKKQKSEMFGAMYLHRPISGVTSLEPDFNITIVKNGSREGYAKNVYGDPQAPVSWDYIDAGDHPAWNLPKAYDKLWRMYEGQIRDSKIKPRDLSLLPERWDVIISTIPLPSICERGHTFEGQKIWVLVDPNMTNVHRAAGSMVYYNGNTPDRDNLSELIGPDWYRFSQLDGFQAWEFSQEVDADTTLFGDRHIVQGVKPLWNNCDCWPRIQKMGRFGKWEKGVLTHHAFEETEAMLVQEPMFR